MRRELDRTAIENRVGIFRRSGWLLSGFLAAAMLVTELAASADTPEWRFVVVGDSPGNPPNTTGVSPDLAEVAQAIADERPAPDFVLFPGDLISSENLSTNVASLSEQYTNWLNAMAPIYNAGIPVYPVRGNHETFTSMFGLSPNNPQPYIDAFSAFGYIPTNGPPNATRLTYSFQHKNCLVLALDLYVNSVPLPDLDIFPQVDQAWVDQQLATNRQPHVFAFGHTPIVQVNINSVIATDSTLAMADAFFDSLVNAGCQIYFCGHDHFYNRAFLERNGRHLCQMIAGGGGAPPELWNPGSYSATWTNCDIRAQLGFHNQGKLGYCVVTVSNDQSISTVMKFLDSTTNSAVTAADAFAFNYSRCATAGMISPLAVAASGSRKTAQGTYHHPVTGVQKKTRQETLKPGSPSSVFPYRWFNRIVLYDKEVWTRTNTAEWNLLENPITPLPCDLVVSVDGTPGNPQTVAYAAPCITETMDVVSNQLVDLPPLPGETLLVNGFYFGVTPPRAWLEYSRNGRIARLMLKADSLRNYPDAEGRPGRSCMDLVTGQSTLRLTIPNAWPPGWNENENHNLVLDNGLGVATLNFSEQPTGTPPE